MLDGLNTDYLVYTSASYTDQFQKCRVVMPLSRPVCAEEYEILSELLCAEFDVRGVDPDTSANRLSQPQYLPMTNEATGYDCQCWRSSVRLTLDVLPFLTVTYNGKIYSRLELKQQEAARIEKRREELKALNADAPKMQGIPYFVSLSDNNILGDKSAATLTSIMTDPKQKGVRMPEAAASVVAASNLKWGTGCVPDYVLETALEFIAGDTSHNNFPKLIRDARGVVK